MRAILVIAVLLCIAASSMAQIGNIDERIVNISFLAPPVEIRNLHAGPVAPNWASDAHKAEVAQPNVLPIYLQVDNISPQTIYAYEVHIVCYDPFGQYIDTLRACSVTALAPQRTDYGRWSIPLRYPDAVWTTVMYPSAVRFSDGTTWYADPVAVSAYFPSAAPVKFHSWHIVPDPREVLPIKMKDIAPPVAPQ